MPDATLQKVLTLLGPDSSSEVRAAAALVIGQVASRDAYLDQALCNLLEDADGIVRQRAIMAIGKLRVEKALPRLLKRVSLGGEEGEAAALAVA
jgi:HEAT repeat protein